MKTDTGCEAGELLGWPEKFGRRQGAAVLVFIIAFVICDRGLAWGLEKMLLSSRFRYSELYRGNNRHGVLIFGNSRGVNGFYSPDLSRELGVPVYNMSYNGLSIGMAELLLLDYLERNPAPKLVILEVTNLRSEELNGDILQLYATCSNRLAAAWIEQAPLLAWIQQYVAQSHRFAGEFFLRVLHYRQISDQNWINRYQIDPAFAENYRPSEAVRQGWHAPIPGRQLEILRRIRDLCISKNIALQLVVTPYLPNHIAHLGGYQRFLEQIEMSSGMPVTDWSFALNSNHHFCNPTHMNLDGFRVLLQLNLEEMKAWLEDSSVGKPLDGNVARQPL